MLDTALFSSLATQLMTSDNVVLEGKRLPVRRIGHQRLKSVTFTANGHEYQAIEQNAEKPSRWGQIARDGHAVVQIKDLNANKFVAVVVDGKVIEYGGMKKRNKTEE